MRFLEKVRMSEAITFRQADHIRAFAASFAVTWGSTPFSNDITNLAYFRSLTCFYGTEHTDLEDRRKLMYQYLSNDFSTDNQDDTINQLYRLIPVEEHISRILRNLCGLYVEAPNRKFSVKNEKLDQAYLEGDVNSAFMYAHRLGKLCNTVLVMPVVRDKKIEIDIFPPDLFRVKTDPKDYRKMIELWIPMSEVDSAGKDVRTFKVWSKDTYYVMDAEGREITSEPNKYGAIPAVILQFNNNTRTDFYGGAYVDLLHATLDCNKLKFLADNDVVFTGMSVWLATNFGKENIKIAPNRILKVDKVTTGEGFEIPPSLESVSGNGVFPNIDEANDARLRKAMRKAGLPESMVSSNPGLAASGFALTVERRELNGLRLEDIGILSKFENLFYSIFANVLNKDLGYGLPEKCSISIDYIESLDFIEEKDRQQVLKDNFEFGIIGAKEFINGFKSDDTIKTDEDAIKLMIENRSQYERLKKNGQSTDTASQITGANTIPVIGEGTDNQAAGAISTQLQTAI
jgi:hypothetical protein